MSARGILSEKPSDDPLLWARLKIGDSSFEAVSLVSRAMMGSQNNEGQMPVLNSQSQTRHRP